MSFLVNRNPSGRIVCLHALLSYLDARFKNNVFKLNDLKYDSRASNNIHEKCTLLKQIRSLNYKICPYLDNELSPAKCGLTQSIQEDTQKSKSASDAFNALEGLGFIKRVEGGGTITKEGFEFISEEFISENTLKRIQKGLLNYGPFMGLLYEISLSGDPVNRADIRLGYPDTDEVLRLNGRDIHLSTGSKGDTITRTRSVLLIWAVTGAFLLPSGIDEPENKREWHRAVLEYIKSQRWTTNSFATNFSPKLFERKLSVDRPLSYNAMTKSTKALRERNQGEQRGITLRYEPIIRNRRFALVYGLSKKSEKNQSLFLPSYIKELKKHPELFIVSRPDFDRVMERELLICNVSGIPYKREDDTLLPLTKLNMRELSLGVPFELIEILDKIIETV